VTFGVGVNVTGCRAEAHQPPLVVRPYRVMLRRLGGSVRIRAPGGPWRALRAGLRLERAVTVDARAGSAHVSLVRESTYTREVLVGRFAGGVFKLGRIQKVGGGKPPVFLGYTTLELTGGLACRGGSGAGRRLNVVAAPNFTVDALRLRTTTLYARPNRPVVSRYTVADRCNGTSTVATRAGRVYVTNQNTGEKKVLGRGQKYVARSRG
jgi:hypothetical protein